MEIVFLILVVGSASFLVLLIAYAVSCYLGVAARRASHSIRAATDGIRETAESTAYEIEREERKQELLKWMDAKIGRQEADSLDYEILEAKIQSPAIRKLIQKEVPKTIERCVKIHRFAALVAGAEFVYEIALTPECFSLRQRVITLLDATVVKLEIYPLLPEDDGLLKNTVALRKIRDICRCCPYLDHPVHQAPALCPSAEIAGIKPEDLEAHDAQS
jgi:hypothetical protein